MYEPSQRSGNTALRQVPEQSLALTPKNVLYGLNAVTEHKENFKKVAIRSLSSHKKIPKKNERLGLELGLARAR